MVTITPYFVGFSSGSKTNNGEATYSGSLGCDHIPNDLRIVRDEFDHLSQLFADKKYYNLGVFIMVKSQLLARLAKTVWITFRPWMQG